MRKRGDGERGGERGREEMEKGVEGERNGKVGRGGGRRGPEKGVSRRVMARWMEGRPSRGRGLRGGRMKLFLEQPMWTISKVKRAHVDVIGENDQ